MTDGQVVSFGKHKGKTFKQVYELDPGYCQWVLQFDSPTGMLLNLQNWLKSQDNIANTAHNTATQKSTESKPMKRVSTVDTARLAAGPPVTKKYKLPGQAHDPLMPPAATNLKANTHALPKQPIQPKLVPQNGPGAGQWQLPTSSNKIMVSGTLVLLVISPVAFTVVTQKKQGNYTRSSPYLDRPVFDVLRVESKLNLTVTGKGQYLGFESTSYERLLKLMQESFECSDGPIQPVPGFVLRSYPAFVNYSQNIEIQRKVYNILSRQQDEKTAKILAEGLPSQLGPELYCVLHKFQREGVVYGLKRNGRVLIADEMGLGKTLQALSLASVYRSEWPVLILCPSSVKFQWRDQALKWLSHCIKKDDIQVVKTGKSKIQCNAQIVISSYDMVTQNEHLQMLTNVIILDESHNIKAKTAKRTKVLVPMIQKSKRAILLSGTPATNKPSELFCQLEALMPKFATFHEFADRYCDTRMNPFSRSRDYAGARNVEELNLILNELVMIRRLKADVQSQLPSKIRNIVPLDLNSKEMADITRIMSEFNQQSDGVEITEPTDGKFQPTAMSECFKQTAVAKSRAAAEYMEYLIQCDCKHVIFGHHHDMLDVLEAKMVKLSGGRSNKGISYIRIDGKTPVSQREALIKEFMDNPSCMVAILSITACGVGLDLTAASTVVFAELYWVPGIMFQAEDRCHRLGTSFNTINIHYLYVEETLDAQIWKILQNKWLGLTGAIDGESTVYKATHVSKHTTDTPVEQMTPDSNVVPDERAAEPPKRRSLLEFMSVPSNNSKSDAIDDNQHMKVRATDSDLEIDNDMLDILFDTDVFG